MKLKKLRKNLIINSDTKIELVSFDNEVNTLFEGCFRDIPEDYNEWTIEIISPAVKRLYLDKSTTNETLILQLFIKEINHDIIK